VESPSQEQEPRRREPRPRAYGNRPQATSTARSTYASDGVPGRRTIQITGQATPPRRRSTTSAALVARPDRTAMWAFLLALFLVLMAVATAHAAV
jgi:hypothetical protein